MFDNILSLPLSKEMSNRMWKVKVFLDAVGWDSNELSMCLYAVMTFSEIVEAHRNGFELVCYTYRGMSLMVDASDLRKVISVRGRPHETWILNDPPKQFLDACEKLTWKFPSVSTKEIILVSLFYFSVLVEKVEREGEFFFGMAQGEFMPCYAQLEVFEKLRPAVRAQ